MKILMLTTVYPGADAPAGTASTSVIRYFVEEWRRMGHEVVAVRLINRLPRPVYYLPACVRRAVRRRTEFEIPPRASILEREETVNGVPVLHFAIFKPIPRGFSSDRAANRCAARIVRALRARDFTPDLILGHWASPAAQLLAALRAVYPCPNALVLHDTHYVRRYPARMRRYLTAIDRLGCRSLPAARETQRLLGCTQTPFVCWSGIPADCADAPEGLWEKAAEPLTRFLFVGALIARKQADTVLSALARFPERDWRLEIVGEGPARERLARLAASLGVADRVAFTGRLPRDECIARMRGAQVFVMVSRNEAFGLVYLEAMASGCLTIGARGEGIDGVIRDGTNGFLSKAGEVEALTDVLRRLFDAPPAQRAAVARAAMTDARAMTDAAMARRYLSIAAPGGETSAEGKTDA